jgi:hypothetical protein
MTMTRFLRTLTRRLHDERGMALVLAIGISTVLAVAGASVVLYSVSNEHHAARTRADTRAYSIAQAGIESAASQIANAADIDNDTAPDQDDPALFSNLPASSKTKSFGTGESVVWDAQLWDDRTGALYVPGSPYYIPKLRWHVVSTSTVPNPAASGTMSRRLQADIQLTPTKYQPVNSESWRFIYSKSDAGGHSEPNGCDIILPNNPNIAASFYVTGDLCLYNNSQIIGSGGPDPVDVIVHGNVYNVSPQSWVGTATNPTNSTYIGLGCNHRNRNGGVPTPVIDPVTGLPGCTFSNHFIWDARPNPPTINPPSADFDAWYSLASPGPNDPCDPTLSSGALPTFDNDATKNGSAPTINLLTMPAFHCETLQGEFSWDPATLKLTVAGTVYYDGTVDLAGSPPVDIEYDSVGALYTTGSIRLGQVRLCAKWSATVCDPTWNGIGPMLLLASDGATNYSQCTNCGILLESSSGFQGAMYATNNIGLQNSSLVQGPMVAGAEIIQNGFTFYPIPRFAQVPFGTPQTPILFWSLLPPTNYKG